MNQLEQTYPAKWWSVSSYVLMLLPLLVIAYVISWWAKIGWGLGFAIVAVGGVYSAWRCYREALTAYFKSFDWDKLGECLALGVLLMWGIQPTSLEVGGLVLAAYAVATYYKRRTLYPLGLWGKWSIALGLAPFVGILWSSSLGLGFSVAMMRLMILVLALASACVSWRPEQLERVLKVALYMGMAWMGIIIVMYLTIAPADGLSLTVCLGFDKLYYLGTDPYNHVMPWLRPQPAFWCFYLGVPLFACCGYWAKGRWANPLDLLVYVLMLVGVCFILQPRYGFGLVGLLGVLVVLGYLYQRWRISLLWLGVGFALVALLGVWVINHLGLFADAYRGRLYHDAWEAIVSNLPLGLGTGADTQLHLETIQHLHSHNSFLTIGVDMGIVGLILLAGWLVLGVRHAVRRRSVEICAFGLVLFPLMLTESPLHSTHIVRLVAVYLFLLLITRPNPQEQAPGA